MTTIHVLHNVGEDNFFGWEPAHSMVPVFAYETDYPVRTDDETKAVLEGTFQDFNVGHDPAYGQVVQRAIDYRARRLRSLSVGDVLIVGDDAYACQPVGWKQISRNGLRILLGDDADKAVRARLQMDPREQLVITVPLD